MTQAEVEAKPYPGLERKPVVYIAGPSQEIGPPDYNRPVFHWAEDFWRKRGYGVLNPFRFDDTHGDAYKPGDEEGQYLRGEAKWIDRDLGLIAGLRPGSEDAVVLLPGWEKSKGASAEAAVAAWRRIKVLKPADWLNTSITVDLKGVMPPFKPGCIISSPVTRTFTTGANRDLDTDKLDYEGFLSPLVLERFAQYMHKHRHLADGSWRDSDNWQQGMPRSVYVKSLWRHFMEVWKAHRSAVTRGEALEEALCALYFNTAGLLREVLLGRDVPLKKEAA